LPSLEHHQQEKEQSMPSRKAGKSSKKGKKNISVKPYKGMPNVELTDDEKVVIHLKLNDSLSKKIVKGAAKAKGPISISLESLDVDLQHGQSYGVVSASTGCISNPGGPSC